MEEDYISISTLNDFIFCPYSIYLHNVYENTDESLFHATPQTQGRIAHEAVDDKKRSLDYYKAFVEALMSHKMNIILFVQSYYRAFMRSATTESYPQFRITS